MDTSDKLSALKKLRELPRGTNVDSRVAAIQDMLGEQEIFHTIQSLRWPLGVVCPRCYSHNVTVIDSPEDAQDERQYYECLNCKGEGGESIFDDLTDFPVDGDLAELRQWVLCWYMIGFCSIAQISKVLGLSMQEVMVMAEQGSKLNEIPKEAKTRIESTYRQYLQSKQASTQRVKDRIEHDERKSRSKEFGKFKPGPKSSA